MKNGFINENCYQSLKPSGIIIFLKEDKPPGQMSSISVTLSFGQTHHLSSALSCTTMTAPNSAMAKSSKLPALED